MYGTDTRSYNRSSERREMKRQMAEATAVYEAQPHEAAEIRWSMCTCRSFRFPHDPAQHKELRNVHDWRAWDRR